MEAKTSNTTIPEDNPRTGTTWPDMSTKAETETIEVPEAGFYGMPNSLSTFRGALVRLSEVIKQGEKKGKEKEMKMEAERETKLKEYKEKEMEMEVEMETKLKEYKEKKDGSIATTTTVTTPAPTGAQILAPQVAHRTSPERLKIEKNSTSSAIMHRKIATTGKVVKVPRARTPREALQCSKRRSMRIFESVKKHAQDKLVVASSMQEEGSTVTSPAQKAVEGLRSQIATMTKGKAEMKKVKETTIKVNSPLLKPRDGAGIAKKTAVGGLKCRIVKKAKAKAEMTKEVENQSITPAATIDRVTEAPPARTPPEVPQSLQCRSMRTTESAHKPGQDKLAVASARREEGLAVDAQVEKAIADLLSSQIAPKTKAKAEMEKVREATIKVNSQLLKPRAGAGITKKTAVKPKGKMEKGFGSKSITTAATTHKVIEPHRSRASPKVLRSPQRRSMRILESTQRSSQDEGASAAKAPAKEKRVIKTSLRGQIAAKATLNIESTILKPRTSARVTKKAFVGGMKARIMARGKAEVEVAKEVENQSITPTTIDKVAEAPHSRTSTEVLNGPQRRSTRIIESMQKIATEGRESTRAALVEGKKPTGAGFKRQIAVAVLINAKSPVLKPRARAGGSNERG